MPRRTRKRDTVLFVSAGPHLGGSQVSLLTALGSMTGRIRVALAAPSDGLLIERLNDRQLVDEYIVIPNRGMVSRTRAHASTALILLRWLHRNRARLIAVHANGDSELKLMLPVLPFISAPLIVWYHSRSLSPSTARLAPLWRLLHRHLLWAPVSESVRQELTAAGIGSPRNVVVVPNPIDPADVVPSKRRQHAADLTVVGYLGCESVLKGFLLLPAIAERLRGTPVRLLCVIKGWPAQQNPSSVNAALRELQGMEQLVVFRRRDHDVRNIYAEIDALVVPSLSESFCRIAAEAMLNEIPVIASDLPAIREISSDGNAALLFATGDADAAAEAIKRVVEDPALAARLSAEGRRQSAAFAPRRVAAMLLQLYESSTPIDMTCWQSDPALHVPGNERN